MENIKNKDDVKVKHYKIFCVLTGLITGFINGLFGGGGGMIVVPMLMGLLKYSTKNAHATAILIILPLSIISGLFYAIFGKFQVDVGFPVLLGVLIGGLSGAILLKKLSSKWIQIIFSIVMMVAGIRLIFQ